MWFNLTFGGQKVPDGVDIQKEKKQNKTQKIGFLWFFFCSCLKPDYSISGFQQACHRQGASPHPGIVSAKQSEIV